VGQLNQMARKMKEAERIEEAAAAMNDELASLQVQREGGGDWMRDGYNAVAACVGLYMTPHFFLTSPCLFRRFSRSPRRTWTCRSSCSREATCLASS